MAAGVPIVCVPFGRDQPEIGRRVAESGAGAINVSWWGRGSYEDRIGERARTSLDAWVKGGGVLSGWITDLAQTAERGKLIHALFQRLPAGADRRPGPCCRSANRTGRSCRDRR